MIKYVDMSADDDLQRRARMLPNVEALGDLLHQAMLDGFDMHSAQTNYDEMAEWLAARGVLVPSVLADDDADEIRSVGSATAVRSALERIAKG